MSILIEQARKFKTWELLHSMTGMSKVYCKKVVTNKLKQKSTAAKLIMEKFAELEKMLIQE
jgi:cyanate lyase